MKRRSIVAAPFLVILLGFAGCSPIPPDYTYKVTAISLCNQNDSGPRPVNDTSGKIPATAYVLEMAYVVQIYNVSQQEPGDSGYMLGIAAVGFNIFSLTDFDSTHPAMSSLNNYFSNSGDSVYAGAMFGDVYLQWPNTKTSATDSAHLLLKVAPQYLGYRTFVVQSVFADSTKFSDTISVTLY